MGLPWNAVGLPFTFSFFSRLKFESQDMEAAAVGIPFNDRFCSVESLLGKRGMGWKASHVWAYC